MIAYDIQMKNIPICFNNLLDIIISTDDGYNTICNASMTKM